MKERYKIPGSKELFYQHLPTLYHQRSETSGSLSFILKNSSARSRLPFACMYQGEKPNLTSSIATTKRLLATSGGFLYPLNYI